MFDTRTRLFFTCLKDTAGAALKRRQWLSAQTNKKIGTGFGAALKVAALGGTLSATLPPGVGRSNSRGTKNRWKIKKNYIFYFAKPAHNWDITVK